MQWEIKSWLGTISAKREKLYIQGRLESPFGHGLVPVLDLCKFYIEYLTLALHVRFYYSLFGALELFATEMICWFDVNQVV